MDKNARVYGGVAPPRGKQAVTRVGQLRFGAALHDCPSLLPLSRGARSPLGPFLLHILEQQDEVLARERDPLVLKLDTFGETIGRIPVLRGPRLHVL